MSVHGVGHRYPGANFIARHARGAAAAHRCDPRRAVRDGTLGEALEPDVAQPAEQPALDDQHRPLDLRLVLRTARPGRQHAGAVMPRHLRIGTVDLGIVEARADHRDLGVVAHQQLRRAAFGVLEDSTMRPGDPVMKPGRSMRGMSSRSKIECECSDQKNYGKNHECEWHVDRVRHRKIASDEAGSWNKPDQSAFRSKTQFVTI